MSFFLPLFVSQKRVDLHLARLKTLSLSTMGEKRQREHKGSGAQFKKRKRTGNIHDAESSVDNIVRIDDLNWKKVTLPDRIDNVEGFYGLEEIEGVDVVRPEGGGEVQFKVSQLEAG